MVDRITPLQSYSGTELPNPPIATDVNRLY